VAHSSQTRPLDALAIATVVGLCLCWGFNQVAIKFAIHEVPPIIQATLRSSFGALFVGAWALSCGIPLFKRDGTLLAGIVAGALFAIEFLLIARGLVWTTATRATLFLYVAPFVVVIGSRWFIPGDQFHASQWLGLLLSFIGLVLAFGLPTPASDPHQLLGDIMMVGAAVAWAATTLVIKASALNKASAEKNLLYQLVVSAPLLAIAALAFGEHIEAMPSAPVLATLTYQIVWVVSVTFLVWFALVVRYSATRLSAFTFLTPLFGVAAGHLLLKEPLTIPFAVAVVLVAIGLVLVNRPRQG
jgi:drug/metabolite transporter (DMT)-like permease